MAGDVRSAIERSVAPSIIARGGSVRLVTVEAGMVTLEASGSPGAVLPATPHIEALLRAAVPQVTGLRGVWPGMGPPTERGGDLTDRVRQVVDAEVKPAVAAHGAGTNPFYAPGKR